MNSSGSVSDSDPCQDHFVPLQQRSFHKAARTSASRVVYFMSMRLRRFTPAVVGIAAMALAAPPPASAKEGVEATLASGIPLDAPAGTRLDVAWTLASIDEQGKRQPFGAGGLFVRLVSASGAQPETAFASGDRGTYEATVVVPKGGIGDVEFGLVGWQSGENGTRRADRIFPITNDPVPGGGGASERTGPGSATWILVVAGLLSVLAYLAFPLVRRRPLGRFG